MLQAFFTKLSALLTAGLCGLPYVGCANTAEISAPPATLNLTLPAGFKINAFAKLQAGGSSMFTGPRMMAFDKQGRLFVTTGFNHQVLMLEDANKDGIAEKITPIASQLNAPNGLTFVGNDLLVANQDSIVKLSEKAGQWQITPLINELPTGGHTLKNMRLGPDGFLYVSVGSSCNVCVESDPYRATILRYTATGQAAGALATVGRHAPNLTWATGLRNSQGLAWHPVSAELYATNEGADMRAATQDGKIDDDLPPEHLNVIKAGNNYGWPYCWGNRVPDPNFAGPDNFCQNSTPPAITFTSHSTPIGIAFLNQTNFPAEYKTDAIVALHGSWNRATPSGYKLVRVKFKANKPIAIEDFATGWLQGNSAWGRPVDVVAGPDGALYVSDDRSGYIYRIRYAR